MNLAAFFLGVATPFVLFITVAYLLDWRTSVRDWRQGYGKGFYHNHQAYQDGRWMPVQHTHKWPGMTPWFVVKARTRGPPARARPPPNHWSGVGVRASRIADRCNRPSKQDEPPEPVMARGFCLCSRRPHPHPFPVRRVVQFHPHNVGVPLIPFHPHERPLRLCHPRQVDDHCVRCLQVPKPVGYPTLLFLTQRQAPPAPPLQTQHAGVVIVLVLRLHLPRHRVFIPWPGP